MIEHGRTIKTCQNMSKPILSQASWNLLAQQRPPSLGWLCSVARSIWRWPATGPNQIVDDLVISDTVYTMWQPCVTVSCWVSAGICRVWSSIIEIYRTSSMKASSVKSCTSKASRTLVCQGQPLGADVRISGTAASGNRYQPHRYTTCSPCRAWRGADGPKETWSRSHLRPTSTMLARTSRIDIGMVSIIIMIIYVIYC